MKGFLDPDSGILGMLGRLGDLMLLNLLFLLCCLPVFTIGASISAMCTVTLRYREGNEGYTVRGFFEAFRKNFKQATAIWILLLGILIVMLVDLFTIRSMTGPVGTYFRIILVMLAVLWLILIHYVFFIQAKFENTVWKTIANAMILAIVNFPRTIWMLALFGAMLFLLFFNVGTFVAGLLILGLVGFALLNWIDAFFVWPVIQRVMKEKIKESDDTMK